MMSNHLHLVLRNRPDIAGQWSADEIALRWCKIFPPRHDATGEPVEPNEHDLAMLTANSERLAELRERLSSLSWLMRCLCEKIARDANHEDDSSGRFWAGRFKSVALLDESAILACSVYVDLNPIRAGLATTPEESAYTSGCDRIRSMVEISTRLPSTDEHSSRETRERPDAWLCELTLQETAIEPASPTAVERCLPTARISITSRANRDRRRGRGRWLPAFRRFRSNFWRRCPSRGPAASACEGVGPRVPADPGRALCHAAGLDGAGTSRGQARGDSGSPGPHRGQAGDQSIELGGNGARLRSTIQTGGGATELARRCRGAPLAALVPGQGGGSNRLCVGHWLDAEP